MKKLLICFCFTLFSCSIAQAQAVDFTQAPAAGENQATILTGRRNNTSDDVFEADGMTVASSSLLEQVDVPLGNGVTANISVRSGNGNAWVISSVGGLGHSGGQANIPTNQQQLSPNQLFIFTLSNVQLNGAPLTAGTSVNFDLNSLLYADPAIGGFVFDGSVGINGQISSINIGVDGNEPNTTSAGMLIGSMVAAGEVGTVSTDNLAFATSSGFDTIELAPSPPVNFTTDLRLRSNGTDTFFLQGLDITANVTTGTVIKGDVDLDGAVTFLDIQPFILLLSGNGFQAEADCDCDGDLDFLDIQPFINILAGN